SRDVRAKPAYRNRSAAQSLRVRSSKTAARRRGPSGIASGLGRCRAVLPSIRPRRPRSQDYRSTRTSSTCRASELECVKGIGFMPVGGFHRHASLDVSRAGFMSVAIIAGIHPTIPRASGIRSYAVGLARGLSRVGEKVILVGVGPEASLDFASFQSVNPNYPVSTFTFVRSLARWIRHHPFERGTVLHGQRPDDLLPLMRLRGRPRIVCTVHGDPRRGILERHACLVRGLYRAAERKTLSRADHVICVSQTGLEVYLKRFPQFRRKISVIPV